MRLVTTNDPSTLAYAFTLTLSDVEACGPGYRFTRPHQNIRARSACSAYTQSGLNPALQSTTKHSWAVKASAQLEKPRCIILVLQTDGKNVMSEDVTKFNNCKLANVNLFLKSEFYPYDDLNMDFDKNKHAILFHMYTQFRKSYYGNTATRHYSPWPNFYYLVPSW